MNTPHLPKMFDKLRHGPRTTPISSETPPTLFEPGAIVFDKRDRDRDSENKPTHKKLWVWEVTYHPPPYLRVKSYLLKDVAEEQAKDMGSACEVDLEEWTPGKGERNNLIDF
ncbi:hypothetical protein HO173_010784 [Letharia columbiana]|uniref:Uncharacterized protein n=1 Tax=Letharia columbiana TaxID=112416 RepID=A0A8H6FM62_9LECA|nr:uncharacterized protein HO173_010784 [Letharia columbiana]KAF6231084.1 hypothetical protein HO173_010784 [Letharia columbiana]